MRRLIPLILLLPLSGCVWSLDFSEKEKESIAAIVQPISDLSAKLLPALGTAGGFVLGGPAGAVAGNKLGETLAYGVSAVATGIAGVATAHAAKKGGEAKAAEERTKGVQAAQVAADRAWDEATLQAKIKS